MLHYFHNFVQLPTSEAGECEFKSNESMQMIDSHANENRNSPVGCRGMAAGLLAVRRVDPGVSFSQPGLHQNPFMEE
jgi:hypothetical protein